MRTLRFLSVALLAAFLASCKIGIAVFEGGKVVSLSGEIDCNAGRTCIINVNDTSFYEELKAVSELGWKFAGWHGGSGFLCGNEELNCVLSTETFASNPVLMAILASDATFYIMPKFVVDHDYVPPSGDMSIGPFTVNYYHSDAFVGTDTVQAPDINYAWSDFLGIKSEDFSANWTG